jgi:hypothetical protein
MSAAVEQLLAAITEPKLFNIKLSPFPEVPPAILFSWMLAKVVLVPGDDDDEDDGRSPTFCCQPGVARRLDDALAPGPGLEVTILVLQKKRYEATKTWNKEKFDEID